MLGKPIVGHRLTLLISSSSTPQRSKSKIILSARIYIHYSIHPSNIFNLDNTRPSNRIK